MRAWPLILWTWTAASWAEDAARDAPALPLVRVEVEVPLDFVSIPEGARVTVDGAARCKRTPCRRLTGMGEHEAVFELDGEHPFRLRFRVPQVGAVQADFHAGGPAVARTVEAARTELPSVPGAPSDVAGRDVTAHGQAALGALLARHWSALAFCHNVARAKDRAVPVRGRVVLEWGLLPSGRVERVQVIDDTLGSPAVASCLVSQVRRLRFAAGAVPLAVRYPVQFPLLGPTEAHLAVESRPAKR
jgi:hypothetical protein